MTRIARLPRARGSDRLLSSRFESSLISMLIGSAGRQERIIRDANALLRFRESDISGAISTLGNFSFSSSRYSFHYASSYPIISAVVAHEEP